MVTVSTVSSFCPEPVMYPIKFTVSVAWILKKVLTCKWLCKLCVIHLRKSACEGRKSLQSERHASYSVRSPSSWCSCPCKGYWKSPAAFSSEPPLPGSAPGIYLFLSTTIYYVSYVPSFVWGDVLCIASVPGLSLCHWSFQWVWGCISDWDLNLSVPGKLCENFRHRPSFAMYHCGCSGKSASGSPQTAWNNLGSSSAPMLQASGLLQCSPFQEGYFGHPVGAQCQLKSHKKNKHLNTLWWSLCAVPGTKPPILGSVPDFHKLSTLCLLDLHWAPSWIWDSRLKLLHTLWRWLHL